MSNFTQAILDNEINTLLASGSDLTASNLRQVLHDMNSSTFQGTPPTAIPVIGSVLVATSALTSVWTPNPFLGVNGGIGGSLTFNAAITGSVTLSIDPNSNALYFSQANYGTIFALIGAGGPTANYIGTISAVSNVRPIVKAIGTDTNVSLGLQAQGGFIELLTPAGIPSLTSFQGIQIGAPAGGDIGTGTLNTAGSIYINSIPVEVAYRLGGTVGAVANTHYNLTLPSGITVTGVTAYTLTAFLASGSVTLQAGTGAGDNSYIAAQSIKSLGVVPLSFSGASAPQGQYLLPATSPNYCLTIVQGGTPSATGSALILIKYAVP